MRAFQPFSAAARKELYQNGLRHDCLDLDERFEDSGLDGSPELTTAVVVRRRHSRPIGWRSLFGALVLLSVLQTLTYLANGFDLYLFPWWGGLNSIPTWGQFLVCGWVVIVSTSDLMAGQRRDWLHWTGVTTYVAYTGMSLFCVQLDPPPG